MNRAFALMLAALGPYCILSTAIANDSNRQIFRSDSGRYSVSVERRETDETREELSSEIVIQLHEESGKQWERKADFCIDQQWNVDSVKVSDSGTTAIVTRTGGICLLDVSGKVIFYDAKFLSSRRPDFPERLSHVIWSHSTDLVFFAERPNRFVYRGWPFGRIDVDLASATLHREKIDKEEIAELRRRLTSTNASQIRSALFWVGELRLEQLQQHVTKASSALQVQAREIDIRHIRGTEHKVGNAIADDLSTLIVATNRRLRLRPQAGGVLPVVVTDGKQSLATVSAVSFEERHMEIRNIGVGTNRSQLFSAIGSPDYVSIDDWFYEVLVDDPYSIFLDFEGDTVVAIHRIKPTVSNSRWLVDYLLFSTGNMGAEVSAKAVDNSLNWIRETGTTNGRR